MTLPIAFVPPSSSEAGDLAALGLRMVCGVTAVWLAAAATAVLLLRRRSAALRHRVWSLSVVAALLLPVVLPTLPEWRVGAIQLAGPDAAPRQSLARLEPAAPVAAAAADGIALVRESRGGTQPPQAPARRTPAPPHVAPAARPADATAPATPPAASVPAPHRAVTWSPWLLLAIWLIPATALVLRLVTSIVRARRLVRRSTPLDDSTASAELTRLCARLNVRAVPRLFESHAVDSPLCTGIVRPGILLPDTWRTWTPSQLHAVLTHELAHVARRDVLWQALARLACAVYWFHPLAHLAAARMRVERELACDDWVLRAGEPSTRYARWLVDFAASLPGHRPSIFQPTGVAMASRGGLERRIVALLDPSRRRLPVTRRAGVLLFVAAALVLVAVGTLSPLAPRSAIAQQAAPPADADFPPPKVMALTVVDAATNRPLDGVKLTVSTSGQRRSLTTDDEGLARFDLIGEVKALTVRTQRDGYVPITRTWAPGQTGKPLPAEYVLALEAGTTIGGRVTDENGTPIEGVDVGIWLRRKGEESIERSPEAQRTALYDQHARTDKDGRWSFDLAPKDLDPPGIRLSHPNFLSDENFRNPPIPVEKFRDQTAVLVMGRGVRVAGRVLDAQGKPVAGARLVMGDAKYGLKPPTATAGEDGRFELPHCRPGRRADLVATATGRRPALKQFNLDKDMTGLELRMEPARPLRVRVVDPQGKPLAGARIGAKVWQGTESLNWDARTDGEGRAVWEEAPAEPVTYGIYHPGYIQLTDKSLTATGEREQVVTLLPQLTVRGAVVDDETGKPLEQFRVIRGWTSPGRDQTPFWNREERPVKQEVGRFEVIEDSDRFGYAVRIEAAGYLPAESRVIKGEEANVSLEFRLKKGKDLAATVHGPDGKPLAGADVLIASASSQIFVNDGAVRWNQTFCDKTRTDGAGRFRFEPQSGKFLLLVVHAAGYAELTPEQLAQAPAVITLAPWAQVEGTVRVGAKPGAGVEISVMPDRRDRPDERGGLYDRLNHEARALADDQGRFVIERARPGGSRVAIRQKTGETARSTHYSYVHAQRVELEPGKTARVSIGGAGRPVVGRLVAPAAVAQRVDWHYTSTGLSTKVEPPPRPALPIDWAQMDKPAQENWMKAWQKRPEVKQAYEKYRQAMEKQRYFPVAVARDGSFRVEDVPAGVYELRVNLSAPPTLDTVSPGGTLAAGRMDVTVPEMPGGRSDDPLDLGKIELKQ